MEYLLTKIYRLLHEYWFITFFFSFGANTGWDPLNPIRTLAVAIFIQILFDREKVALRNYFMLSIDSKLFFPVDVYKICSLYDQ